LRLAVNCPCKRSLLRLVHDLEGIDAGVIPDRYEWNHELACAERAWKADGWDAPRAVSTARRCSAIAPREEVSPSLPHLAASAAAR
jgi:hypothetical protein